MPGEVPSFAVSGTLMQTVRGCLRGRKVDWSAESALRARSARVVSFVWGQPVVSLSRLKLRATEPGANSLSRAGVHASLNAEAWVEVGSHNGPSLAVVNRSEARVVSQRQSPSWRARSTPVVLCEQPSNPAFEGSAEQRRCSVPSSLRSSAPPQRDRWTSPHYSCGGGVHRLAE
jgi:hypothetical protein